MLMVTLVCICTATIRLYFLQIPDLDDLKLDGRSNTFVLVKVRVNSV